MSKERKVTIKCRKCGKEFDAVIYDSVNVDINPELREPFIFDQLYIFECPHCKEKIFQAYPILYHDMKHKFMVQGGSLSHIYGEFYNFIYDNSDDERMKLVRMAHEGYTMVGAQSTMHAREKVVALENGLDHRLVAIYRYLENARYNEYAEKNGKPRSEDAYLCYDDDENLSIIIDVYDDETKQATCVCSKFDKKIYEQLAEAFGPEIEKANSFLFTDWAIINYLNYCNSKNKDELKVTQKFAVIEAEDGIEGFALIKSKDEFKKGDKINIYKKESLVSEGMIISICEFNRINAPFNYDYFKEITISKK